MAKKQRGVCRLCGNEGELSFEHIPPKAAFNKTPAKAIVGLENLVGGDRHPWETEGLRYQNLQQGVGLYSLCEKCNSFTGSAYGEDYKAFAERALYVVSSDVDPTIHYVVFKAVHPLRVFKQIISMFCSTTPVPQMEELKDFVLDKNRKGIDTKKYGVRMYFTRNDVIKWTGKTVLSKMNEHNIITLSEITAYPLGFLLYFNPEEVAHPEGIDITCFSEYGYDDLCDISLPILIYEVNSALPTDFRSKEEICKILEQNRVGQNAE